MSQWVGNGRGFCTKKKLLKTQLELVLMRRRELREGEKDQRRAPKRVVSRQQHQEKDELLSNDLVSAVVDSQPHREP